ncbi:putative fluoride ion transporter CrcB 2 [Hoyosella rhizosphaerae]|uniref:Fluoride-specific ion channel FluC n=2 Tax=Hoyosella rhizosphaerae TaxID=1755582 RepID=A0A916U8M8_9ACTN|nr:putative fluoride ion transporter CrcB 2 [Hoyosella rhizosphaerae]
MWVLVAVGAAVGAPLRYLTDRWVGIRFPSVFPWGTFVVNITGAALLGFVVAAAAANQHLASGFLLLFATGVCGAYTTFSTFAYETMFLAESGSRTLAVANVVGTVCAGIAAFVFGASAYSLF